MNLIDRPLVILLNPNESRLDLLKMTLAGEAIVHHATSAHAFIDLVGVSGEARVAIISSDAELNEERLLNLMSRIKDNSPMPIVVGYRPHQLKLTSIHRENVRFVAEGLLAASAREFLAA